MQVFLQTDRLVLRPLSEDDVENLFELHNDPEVMRYINGGKPTSREVILNEVLPRMVGGFSFWAATLRATGEFLGWFEFRPTRGEDPAEVELGYRLRRAAWGMGYATEGARALIRKGFTELGVKRVIATTMTVNLASRRVLEKAGMKFVRTFHQEWPEQIEGGEQGDVEYALDRTDHSGGSCQC